MSFQRSASALGFGWQDMMRLNRKAKTTTYKIRKVEKALLYWLGPGAMLNRLAAEDLRDYFQKSITEQKDIDAAGTTLFKYLSPKWRATKWRHRDLIIGAEKMAIAYGEMRDSIEAIDSGGGKWKVGIKQSGRRKRTLSGNTKLKVHVVAEIFEKGSVKQQARPIFMHYFLEWLKKKAPVVAKKAMTHLAQELNDLRGEWEGSSYIPGQMARRLMTVSSVEGELLDVGSDDAEQEMIRDIYAKSDEGKQELAGFMAEEDEGDEFGDTSEFDKEQQNILLRYQRFLNKVEKDLSALIARPVNAANLESKDFWNGLSMEFQHDKRIWEIITKWYMQLWTLRPSS